MAGTHQSERQSSCSRRVGRIVARTSYDCGRRGSWCHHVSHVYHANKNDILTPSSGGEELPRAYLVRKEGAKVDAAQINDFMKTRVAPHKRLAGGVSFIETIPKNPVCVWCMTE